jgi:hypothetical protein
MICERCGLQWALEDIAPSCDPMTFGRMRDRLLTLITRAEVSLSVITDLKREGTPADPAPVRRELAELNALLRLFERVTGDQVIRDQLNGKAR